MHRKIQVSKLPLILVLSLICWENGTMSFLHQSHSKGQTKTILYLTFHIQLKIFFNTNTQHHHFLMIYIMQSLTSAIFFFTLFY